jgi:hypothetical protein
MKVNAIQLLQAMAALGYVCGGCNLPTSYTVQFFRIDPFAPPAVSTPLSVELLEVIDENDDFDIEVADPDTVGGLDIDQSYLGDTVTINVPGVGDVTYTGTTFYLSDGEIFFTPTDGQFLQDGTFVSSTFVTTQGPLPVGDLAQVCFTAGTLIATPDGSKKIETLSVGNLVDTLDNGPQVIRWIGTRTFTGRDLLANPKLRPILITQGALGDGLPNQDLIVSRQHRILTNSKIVESMFNVEEVLVPAIKLVAIDGISEIDVEAVTYIHLLFDNHEIIFSNAAPTETLFTGAMALDAVGAEARKEVFAIFPELERAREFEPARRLIDDGRGRKLADRHMKNEKPLLRKAALKV